ncbi:FxLD family lanthipeptide [Kitasatospora viridis]|uniref:FxLD family lantipeptide n=1 Tax=Kitasatospora viridis TaxID=281105 RepID=A0A561UGX3_9ACTN|nr:FxLD family lanthipeptide [Kitasatospora viridis]TWF98595.1 FxLD family lantipeptide [Kitasatospora viridis]
MAPTQLIPASLKDVDLLDLDVTVTAEAGAEARPVACGSSDGCGASCASACISAV